MICPKNLHVLTDRMRLKQICLNLSNNAAKFVSKGFIRLRAEVVPPSAPEDCESLAFNDVESAVKGSHRDGNVVIYIEDSGPGIPEVKRKQLFKKFQDSLDVLNQGTGIGLSVCKNLSELMEASLSLDDNFESGIPGCPGTCFVLELNRPPLEIEHGMSVLDNSDGMSTSFREDLPANLSVLFVDDGMFNLSPGTQICTKPRSTHLLLPI